MKKKDKGAGENSGLPLKADQQAQELRRQAEQVIRQQDALPPVDMESLTLEKSQKLLQELQVHQVELAMQNEELRSSQMKLEKSRARYFELYDLAPVGYLTVSEQGYITLANLTFTTLLGVERSALENKPLSRYILKEDQDVYYRHSKKLFESGEDQQCELRMVKADGTAFWAKLQGNFVPAEDDGVPFCRLTLSDITESKKADDQLRFQAQVIENSPIIVAYHDKDLNIVWVNRAYEEATGLSLEECRGKKCYRVWNLSKPCRGCPVITAIETGENAAFELTPDNQDHWSETQGYWLSESAPVRDEQGAIIGAIEFAINITGRKRAEAEILKLNEELEQRVKERTIELEAANKEIASFAYSISHDFRAPLRTLDGFSAILTEKYNAQLDDQGRHYLDRIRKTAIYMSDLVDAVLALSRITRAEVKEQEVDLSQIAEEIIKDLQGAEPERQVTVAVEPGLSAKGDFSLLKDALENLLGNAWKFSSKEEQATIEVGRANEDGEEIFFVRDNGVGFNMAYADKLFGAFQRLHGVDEFPGTGIGLATVQRIINRHGGRIWATSEVGKGATFYFTLQG